MGTGLLKMPTSSGDALAESRRHRVGRAPQVIFVNFVPRLANGCLQSIQSWMVSLMNLLLQNPPHTEIHGVKVWAQRRPILLVQKLEIRIFGKFLHDGRSMQGAPSCWKIQSFLSKWFWAQGRRVSLITLFRYVSFVTVLGLLKKTSGFSPFKHTPAETINEGPNLDVPTFLPLLLASATVFASTWSF